MQKIILIILSLNLLNASYDVGEIISVTDQNINKSTCYEGNDYQMYVPIEFQADYSLM